MERWINPEDLQAHGLTAQEIDDHLVPDLRIIWHVKFCCELAVPQMRADTHRRLEDNGPGTISPLKIRAKKIGLNGLGSPFVVETVVIICIGLSGSRAKWPGEPVRV